MFLSQDDKKRGLRRGAFFKQIFSSLLGEGVGAAGDAAAEGLDETTGALDEMLGGTLNPLQSGLLRKMKNTIGETRADPYGMAGGGNKTPSPF